MLRAFTSDSKSEFKDSFEKNLYIYEGNFESTGGRKAQVISINGAARYVISVNLSDKGIKADILDLNCNVIGNMRVPVKYEKGSAYGEMVADTVTRLAEHTGIDKSGYSWCRHYSSRNI